MTFASHAQSQLLALLIAGHQLAMPTEHASQDFVRMLAATYACVVIALIGPSE